jgi:uncharacterized protein (TIGR02145 family)
MKPIPFKTCLLVLFLTGCWTCSKDRDDQTLPAVNDFAANAIRRTWASFSGSADSALVDYSMIFGVCLNTTGDPKISDTVYVGGVYETRFSVNAGDLQPNTTYYVRWYVSDISNIRYGAVETIKTMPAGLIVTFNASKTYGSVTDIEGNVYKTIDIGNQTWMAENLKTTRLNDNNEIPFVTGNSNWMSQHSPAYSWYEDNEDIYRDIYGAYYNWYTVNTGKLCPSGWHVPSDDEWQTLELEMGIPAEYLNYAGIRGTTEGLKLMEAGTGNWITEEALTGTNESGFTALPGGMRGGANYYGDFDFSEGWSASWWTSRYEYYAYFHALYSAVPGIYKGADLREFGRNVRCVKDQLGK